MSALILHSIDEAIADIAAGKMVIVVDDPSRENEADLVAAASKITPEKIAFMANHGRGLICLPMTAERIEQLRLPMMAVTIHLATRPRSPSASRRAKVSRRAFLPLTGR